MKGKLAVGVRSSHFVSVSLSLFVTVALGGSATAQNLAARFFYYGAESRSDGQWTAQPPFFPQPWQAPLPDFPKPA